MKNLKALKKLMVGPEKGNYNPSFKERFETIGRRAMEELAALLGFRDYRVHFNPGGIAVSGDLHLMGMWGEGNGVHVFMNKDFPQKPWGDVLYRHIRSLEDFRGGPNNYFYFSALDDPEALYSTITRLKREKGGV